MRYTEFLTIGEALKAVSIFRPVPGLKGENLSCFDNWSNLKMKRTPVLTLMSALNKTINGHVEVAILSSKD